MECRFKYKVPGGKLIETVVMHNGISIESVRITGDFFLYPEEKLEAIEKSLTGSRIGSTEEELCAVIAGVVSEEGIEMIGISPEAIARAIKSAVSK